MQWFIHSTTIHWATTGCQYTSWNGRYGREPKRRPSCLQATHIPAGDVKVWSEPGRQSAWSRQPGKTGGGPAHADSAAFRYDLECFFKGSLWPLFRYHHLMRASLTTQFKIASLVTLSPSSAGLLSITLITTYPCLCPFAYCLAAPAKITTPWNHGLCFGSFLCPW